MNIHNELCKSVSETSQKHYDKVCRESGTLTTYTTQEHQLEMIWEKNCIDFNDNQIMFEDNYKDACKEILKLERSRTVWERFVYLLTNK